jgi:hypothetical protein
MTFTTVQGYFQVPEVLKTKSGFIEEPSVAFNPPVGCRVSGRATATYVYAEALAPRMLVKLRATSKTRSAGVVLEFINSSRPGLYNVRTKIPTGFRLEKCEFAFRDRNECPNAPSFAVEISFAFDLFPAEPDFVALAKANETDCVICLERPSSVLIKDCGHAILCEHCVPRFLDNVDVCCPICRKKCSHLTRLDGTDPTLLKKIKI